MKLWFEGWNVNAHDASALRRTPPAARENSLAVNRRRGDSAANNFRPKMRGTPNGLQHV
jgi:hypothetical protein